MIDPVSLPPVPSARLIAFDESVYVNGYSDKDMRDYATLAVEQDRENRYGSGGCLRRVLTRWFV